MVLLFTLVMLMLVCGGFTRTFPLGLAPKQPVRENFGNDLTPDSMNEVYDTYYSVADHKEQELNVISQVQEVDLNKIDYSHFFNINKETYLLVKTMRHRNKRYTSYLTLCPFKICNMGRKRMRTRRYIHLIKATDDNEET